MSDGDELAANTDPLDPTDADEDGDGVLNRDDTDIDGDGEDNAVDAELMIRELRLAGLDIEADRVASEVAYAAALSAEILCERSWMLTVETLGAEIPMAKSGAPQAYNHFGNVVVGLHPQLDLDDRVRRIAAELTLG